MIKRLVIRDCLGIEELTVNPGQTTIISDLPQKKFADECNVSI